MDGEPIAAVATPPGRGALAVVRASGAGVGEVLARLTHRAAFMPRRATRVSLALSDGLHEEAIATWFPGPRSYTGEDSFEVCVHGSPVVTTALLDLLELHGVRAAGRGEFTLRAYLNGKMDLVAAEAVDDLVRAVTPAQARVAASQVRGVVSGALLDLARSLVSLLERLEASLDFPDEGFHFITPAEVVGELEAVSARCGALEGSGVRGRLLRDGARVVIVGRPNVGKSRLFNALLGHDRAIVADVAGTTRDVLQETIALGGVPVVLTDTAGLSDAGSDVEREGVRRAEASAADADLAIMVVDGTVVDADVMAIDAGIWATLAEVPRCLVVNKADVMTPPQWRGEWAGGAGPVLVSAQTGEGLEALRHELAHRVGCESWEPSTVTNARHLRLLGVAHEAVRRAASAAREGATEEFVSADVREALQALEEIRGTVTPQHVLDGIFARFCIGK